MTDVYVRLCRDDAERVACAIANDEPLIDLMRDTLGTALDAALAAPAEGPERAATGERQAEFASALGVPLDTLEDSIAECERKYEYWEVGHSLVRHDHYDEHGWSVKVPNDSGPFARVIDLGLGTYGYGETPRAALRDAMQKSSEREDIAERRKQLAQRAAGEETGA